MPGIGKVDDVPEPPDETPKLVLTPIDPGFSNAAPLITI